MAYETFVLRSYATLLPDANLIVDAGGHCGFTTLYFAKENKNARILVFEPHPERACRIREHVKINGLMDRVEVYEAAVGIRDESMFLSDRGVASRVGDQGIPIHVMDFFDLIRDQKIDILKLDIEGAEYSILADPRFASLKVKFIVMEWHRQPGIENGKQWCINTLSRLGYTAKSLLDQGYVGIIHAAKSGESETAAP